MTRRALRFTLPLVAVLLASAPAFAAGVTPTQATPAQRDDATAHFLKGRDLFNQNKFDAALAEFTASMDVVNSPNARIYVARCHRELGHLTIAHAELTRTLTDAKALAKDDPKYEKTAESAQTEKTELEAKLGFVDLSMSHTAPSTVVKVNGDVVARDAWTSPVPVTPGTMDVVVESEGRPPVVKSIQVAAGEHKPVPIDAGADAPAAPVATQVETPPPPKKVPLRTLAYVAGGVGVAGLATFTIFGIMSNSTYSGLEDSCPNKVCPPGKSDDISKGKTQQTIANIGLVVGAVGVAAGVTLFVISSKKKDPAAASAAVTAGPGYVGLQGAF